MTESEFRAQFPPPEAPPEPPPILTKPQVMAPIKQATIESAMGKKFTVEEVDSCLTRYEGNMRLAAMHLVIDRLKLKKFCKENQELEKWIPVRMKGEDGSVVQVIPALRAKDELLKIAMPGEKEIMSVPGNLKVDELAAQVEKENEAIKEGLITLGATRAKAEEMLNVTKNFQLRHFDQAASFAALGIAVNFTNQLDLLRSIEKRIKERGTINEKGELIPFSVNMKGDPVDEAMLLESYVTISEESRRTAEFWLKAQLTLARIHAIKRAEAKSQKPTARAGFKPKAVNIASAPA